MLGTLTMPVTVVGSTTDRRARRKRAAPTPPQSTLII
jgi:hypothetical protein